MGNDYVSDWGYSHEGRYNVLPGESTITDATSEFNFEYISNTAGLRNPPILKDKPDTTYRILCLGNSYTEGLGAPWGYSFPRQLNYMLNGASNSWYYEVINAGQSRNDIIYSEDIFTNLYHELEADLVLVMITDMDMEFIIQRGGFERFTEDGNTVYKQPPWFHGLYKRSHLARFIIHVVFRKDDLLLSPGRREKENRIAAETIAKSVKVLHEYSQDKEMFIRFVLHPLPRQADPSKFPCLEEHRDNAGACFNIVSDLDMIDFSNNPSVYNIFGQMTDTLLTRDFDYYTWPVDGHYNPRGYNIMARILFDRMQDDVRLLLE